MACNKVTLTTGEGKQHVVDLRMLETSQFIQTMIEDLGLEKVQNKAISLQNMDHDTLKKILDWTAYHSHNILPDDNTVKKRTDEIKNDLKNDIEKEFTIKRDIINQSIKQVEKKISDLETTAGELYWEDGPEWDRIREKKDELLLLKRKYRDLDWQQRLRVDGKALTQAHNDAEEETNKIRDWEDRFIDIGADFLFKVIHAANFLDIPDLLDRSCRKAADMVKHGSLKTLKGLPDEMQIQIARNLCPHAFIRAANARIIPVSHAQMVHAKTWACVCPDDTWFEAAIAAGANPVLIGEDLEWFFKPKNDPNTHLHLVLSPLDWEGDLRYHLPGRDSDFPAKKIYENHLQPGMFQHDTWTFITRNITLYIGEASSHVNNLKQRLGKKDQNGNWETLLLHLRDPQFYRLTYKSINYHESLKEIRIRTNHFTRGGIRIEYPCFDSE